MSSTFPARILGIPLFFFWTLELALVIFMRLSESLLGVYYLGAWGVTALSTSSSSWLSLSLLPACIPAQWPVVLRRKVLYFTWFWRHVFHITVRNFFLIVSEWVKYVLFYKPQQMFTPFICFYERRISQESVVCTVTSIYVPFVHGDTGWFLYFLGMFTKLWKIIVSFTTSAPKLFVMQQQFFFSKELLL